MKHLLTLLAVTFLGTFTNGQTPTYSETEQQQPDTVIKAPYAPPPATEKDMRMYKSAIKFQKTESARVQNASKMNQMRSLTTAQILDFIDYVPDYYRVDFAAEAYKHCIDKENFKSVKLYFKKQADKDALEKYLKDM